VAQELQDKATTAVPAILAGPAAVAAVQVRLVPMAAALLVPAVATALHHQYQVRRSLMRAAAAARERALVVVAALAVAAMVLRQEEAPRRVQRILVVAAVPDMEPQEPLAVLASSLYDTLILIPTLSPLVGYSHSPPQAATRFTNGRVAVASLSNEKINGALC
jgi:hypothetical protein